VIFVDTSGWFARLSHFAASLFEQRYGTLFPFSVCLVQVEPFAFDLSLETQGSEAAKRVHETCEFILWHFRFR
jgi:hypothetical protein